MEITTSGTDEARALRSCLELLDVLEETMDNGAYSEEAEHAIARLRDQWTDELRGVERRLIHAWPMYPRAVEQYAGGSAEWYARRSAGVPLRPEV